MRITIFLISLVLLFVPEGVFAQRKKKDTKQIIISASINYNPASKKHQNNSSIDITNSDISLEYLTPESGIFIVGRETTGIRVDTTELSLPSQRLNIGFSYQVIKNKTSYKEISLNQLSYSSSDKFKRFYYYYEDEESLFPIVRGSRINTFSISFRYEMGKYFGGVNTNKLNFGLGFGTQFGYRFHKDTPYSFGSFNPIVTNIIDLDLYVPIIMRKNINKSISLELKIMPGIATTPYSAVKELNPNISLNAQNFKLDQKTFHYRTSASLHLGYTIKDTAKRGRR